jgi:type II secretory pathway component PulF
VGELSGNLEESLSELAEHLRARQSLRSRLTGALTYPMILVCLGTAVVIFLMSYVIPQLLTVLAASGRPMPASTMVLKTASDFLVYHWASLIVGAVIACGLMAAVYASDAGRLLVHRAQLHVPLVGPLVRKQIIAGFAQQMALLLRTGTPFVDAVRCAAALTGNRVLAGELDQVGRCVESGSDIAPTLANSRIFPPVVIHLIGVGQDSGELTTLLGELRTRYETEVRIAVDRFTTALEPLLIVALASVVGFVVFACLMPILEATRGIS